MEKKIKCLRRKCTVCGESIRIKVYPDKHHHPHYYYGKIKLPIKGTGEYKEIETTKIGRHKISPTVAPTVSNIRFPKFR